MKMKHSLHFGLLLVIITSAAGTFLAADPLSMTNAEPALLSEQSNNQAFPLDCDLELTPLMQSAKTGNLTELNKQLGTTNNINQTTSLGRTALHIALLYQQEDAAIALAQQGADINCIDHFYETPLSIARHNMLQKYIKVHEKLFIGKAQRGNNVSNDDKHFVLLIASYNNAPWYEHNLDMVFQQDYHNFTAIYMDDMSTDGTYDLVSEYLKHHYPDRLTQTILIKNPVKRHALGNYIYAIEHFCPDDTILVCYDGDDWFNHDDELSHLNKLYKNEATWLTYGSPWIWPNNAPYTFSYALPPEILSNIRQFSLTNGEYWPISQIRSFYTWLFRMIKTEDLIDVDGTPYQHGEDIAYMAPMIEMAGPEHITYITKIQYIYNIKNPHNSFKVMTFEEAKRIFRYLLHKKPYERLTTKKGIV